MFFYVKSILLSCQAFLKKRRAYFVCYNIKSICFLLFLGFSYNAIAQNQPPKFIRLTTNEGLSQGHVSAILKDSRGFMWFATEGGLNKYDGYKFIAYKHDDDKPGSISNDIVSDVLEDNAGNLWVATRSGLDKFDRAKEEFIHYSPDSFGTVNIIFEDSRKTIWAGTRNGLFALDVSKSTFTCYKHERNNTNSLSDSYIYEITEDDTGDLWIATKNGLNRFNPVSKHFTSYKNKPNDETSIGADWVMTVYKDSKGNIWAGTLGSGVALYDRAKNLFVNYRNDPRNKNSISLNDVHSFCEDDNGTLWIGTDNGGISVFDYAAKTFIQHKNDPHNANSLGNNSINSLYKDDQGTMWVGTYSEGVNFLPKIGEKFLHYNQSLTNDNSLNDHNVLAIIGDSLGLWIGTDGGGLNRFNRKTQTFTHYQNNKNKNSINSNFVVSVIRVDNDLLGLGLYQGGFDLFNTKTGIFSHHLPDKKNAASLSSSSVSILYKSYNGKIWMGTWGEGLNLYDRKTNSFTHYRNNPNDPRSIISNSINSLLEDKQGNLWIGTDDGLDKLEKGSNTFIHFRHSDVNKKSINQNFVNTLFLDKANNLWVGTSGGLNMFDAKNQTFTAYTENDGLANNTIQSILEDCNGTLWLSSNNGLTRFNRAAKTFRNYDASDGMQGKEFKPNSCFLASDGEMFFGGTNGFNAFYPDRLIDNQFVPPVYVTDFQIFNKHVTAGGENALLQQQISDAKEIKLSHEQSVFSFEFAALNYTMPGKNQYAYKLQGFDKEWNYVGNRRTATYTNLDPGTYTFFVKGSNNDGLWNENATSIKIIILPPYWKTWWFNLILIISVIGSASGFYFYRVNAIKAQKRKLEQTVKAQTAELLTLNEEERKARQEADEANRAKSVFLATMSHEIRTPMNGVIGMASLLMQTEQSNEQRNYTKTIATSGESLLSVINSILDFSKIESGKLELENKLFNLQTCIEEVLDIFRINASDAGLRLAYNIDAAVPLQITGDSLRLRQVLINLVGNAIKFTPRGEIIISVQVLKTTGDDQFELGFEVRDTGIGIASDKLERLFKAFSQVDSSTTRKHGGTGLGLVICEKLVTLMGGSIAVASKPGKGTTFTFSIFTTAEKQSAATYSNGHQPVKPDTSFNIKLADEPKLAADFSIHYPFRILIAEDNPINVLVLNKILTKLGYKPATAENGQEVLNMLERQQFDLIFMDVQMPDMDGFEATRAIRKNSSQQPVIIAMTANAMHGDREECLAAGMDDYLSKPINMQELYITLKKWALPVQL